MMGTETHPFSQSTHAQRIIASASLKRGLSVFIHIPWYYLKWLGELNGQELPSIQSLTSNQEWHQGRVSARCGLWTTHIKLSIESTFLEAGLQICICNKQVILRHS